MTLPVFLLLLFGVVEFGLVLYYKGLITTASRQGARYGAVYSLPARSQNDIQAYTQTYLQGLGLTGAQVTATPAAGSETPVKLVFPLILFIFPAILVVVLGPAVIQIMENIMK